MTQVKGAHVSFRGSSSALILSQHHGHLELLVSKPTSNPFDEGLSGLSFQSYLIQFPILTTEYRPLRPAGSLGS